MILNNEQIMELIQKIARLELIYIGETTNTTDEFHEDWINECVDVKRLIHHDSVVTEDTYQYFVQCKDQAKRKQDQILILQEKYKDLLPDNLKNPNILVIDEVVDIFSHIDYLRNFYMDLAIYVNFLGMQDLYVAGKMTTRNPKSTAKTKVYKKIDRSVKETDQQKTATVHKLFDNKE